MPDTPSSPPAEVPPPKRVGANVVAPPPPDAPLLTFGEAAYLLRVSPTTVRRVVDEGQLRSVRVLGRTLIAREAIDDFIRAADRAKAPTSEAAAQLAAEEQARAEQRMRVRVVADWNTGKDTFNMDREPKPRRKKAQA